ncbi:MAG: ATP synthase subunit I [Oscillospiraceae bacterium]|nr:ATP synthase subunit I [Oscillospiraceae bacterium]
MPADQMQQEIKMLAGRAVFLNIAAYLISVIVLGVTAAFAFGLLLGTAVLIGSLLLLRYSILRMETDAKRTGTASQRRHRMFYALRLMLFAAAFGTALVLREFISPVAVAVPMLYPRLIYTAGALFTRADAKPREKKR